MQAQQATSVDPQNAWGQINHRSLASDLGIDSGKPADPPQRREAPLDQHRREGSEGMPYASSGGVWGVPAPPPSHASRDALLNQIARENAGVAPSARDHIPNQQGKGGSELPQPSQPDRGTETPQGRQWGAAPELSQPRQGSGPFPQQRQGGGGHQTPHSGPGESEGFARARGDDRCVSSVVEVEVIYAHCGCI
jgi:hypothetical protein